MYLVFLIYEHTRESTQLSLQGHPENDLVHRPQ